MQTQHIEQRLDEIARLLALLIRASPSPGAAPGPKSLQGFIEELSGVGIGPSRIADLAGTSPGYVGVALTRAKAAKKKPASKSPHQDT
jgi:hypothetical protein